LTNNHTLGRNHWLREFYSLLEEKTTMQQYKPLTRDSISFMPSGTKLKFGSQIVEFVRKSTIQHNGGGSESVIEYIDVDGKLARIEETLFIQLATEHLDAERCAGCNALRTPEDCIPRVISSWCFVRAVKFCKDKECAKRFFLMHPERKPMTGNWKVS